MRPSSVLSTFVTSAAVVVTTLATSTVASADQTAREKIDQLQSEGFTVNVDRVGSGPIDGCVVTSVRNPQTQTRNVRDYYGPRDANGDRKYRIVEVVVSRTISVSLDCSN
ncbi:hypothetical protein [Mycobacterium sp. NPDC006124]|uniref:hypothetical protein n=1 Tax=Mycobacterium sp. NPDC006124 TaxID=3156729 RepID=UPI0033A603EF